MLRRPLVLCSFICYINIALILLFPHLFPLTSAFVLTVSVTLILCLSKRKRLLLGLFVFSILVSTAVSFFAYTAKEKAALGFVDDMGDTEHEYLAVIQECRHYTSNSVAFTEITHVDQKQLSNPVKARINCYSGVSFEEGNTLLFSGMPVSVYDVENDGFDTKSYLRSKETFIDFPSVTVLLSHDGSKDTVFSRLRKYTSRLFYKYIPSDNYRDNAALSLTIFTGDRDLLSKEIKDTFTRCGLIHLLCVSGLHLAIIAGILSRFLSMLSMHKRLRCVILISVCILYTVFTGCSLSTVRACIMCCIGFTAMLLGRKTDGVLSLFFSLAAICIFSPYSALDISLILSFCATLGIICVSDILPSCEKKGVFQRILYGAVTMISVNLGAVMFSLPVSAYSFGGLSVTSVISTLTVSFIFEILLTALLLLFLTSPLSAFGVFESVFFLIGRLSSLLCSGITGIAEFFSGFRYSSVNARFSVCFVILFIVFITALCFFISFDVKKARAICVVSIICLGVVFSIVSLIFTVIDDGVYTVSYYRKNSNDRELCVKLGRDGYLLINADSSLCRDYGDLPFDRNGGNNYLLIVPDDEIIPSVLADEIKIFDGRYGIKKIFLPQSQGAIPLARELSRLGIECYYMPTETTAGNITINYNCDNGFFISVDDGKTSTAVFFADGYDASVFGKGYEICAYFTRKTANQFDRNTDTPPDCTTFITRLKKDETADGITNTFGEKSVTIKG